VAQVTGDADVLVYPNPNNSSFTIEYRVTGVSQVFVYNSLGQVVYEERMQLNENSRLMLGEPGVYMVTVVTENGQRINRPVIVNR
jgi:hypothetical protein